jgi:hypothetical protein
VQLEGYPSEIHVNDVNSSVPTSQKTHCVTVLNQLMLFWEIICGYCENYVKQIHSLGEVKYFNVKAGGTYSDCCDC